MPAQTRALVNPQADFWLLGGLSLLAPLTLGLFINWENAPMVQRLSGWTYYMAMVVNYPHFAYSYQVFYKGLRRRLFSPEATLLGKSRMILAGFIVPAAMTGYFILAMMTHSMKMMGVSINGMLFLGGWHYARQGYGALITGSAYRNIFYGPRQKLILNANAYLIPVVTWVMMNSTKNSSVFYDIPFAGMALPPWLTTYLLIPVVIFGLLSAAVFLRIWLIDKRGIPVNGVIGYACATYLWVILTKISPVVFYLAPFFHSLQYLPFIYKFKKTETASEEGIPPGDAWKNPKTFSSMVVFTITGIALGAVFLDFLPKLMDLTLLHYTTPPDGFSRNFFLATFLQFINIHHFFIDYAFWRRDNKDVQQFVFRG